MVIFLARPIMLMSAVSSFSPRSSLITYNRGEAEEQKFQARLVINTVTADVPIEDREMGSGRWACTVQLAVLQDYKRAYWEIFFSAMRTKGSSSSHFMALASVMKSNLLDKAGTNILISVLKLDSLGYSDTIFGDLGAAISLFNNDIPALCRSKK
ncbi:MAG: hypothetical protein FRX49_06983 [Trebouxia sp. A1-2]|nr:MAG: hypothetical protein FRX49_06983 [Trebouxia sp. A1-2]